MFYLLPVFRVYIVMALVRNLVGLDLLIRRICYRRRTLSSSMYYMYPIPMIESLLSVMGILFQTLDLSCERLLISRFTNVIGLERSLGSLK